MMKLLTSWSNFWHHDEPIDVITIMLTSGTFWQHDAFCWHPDTLFDLMTNFSLDFCHSDCIFSLFWEQNINKTCFWCYITSFLMSWHVFDVMASWRSLTLFRTFDVFLTLWRVVDVITCFFRHDKLVDDMAKVMTSWTFNVLTHLLRLWRHKHKLTA